MFQIDFVLSLKLYDFELAERTLAHIGLKYRIPERAQDVIKMRKEYINKRNLIAWPFVDYLDPSKQVDILITQDLKDLEVETISVAGRKLRVATLKEIAMKKKAGRPQDLVDIKNINKKLNGKK